MAGICYENQSLTNLRGFVLARRSSTSSSAPCSCWPASSPSFPHPPVITAGWPHQDAQAEKLTDLPGPLHCKLYTVPAAVVVACPSTSRKDNRLCWRPQHNCLCLDLQPDQARRPDCWPSCSALHVPGRVTTWAVGLVRQDVESWRGAVHPLLLASKGAGAAGGVRAAAPGGGGPGLAGWGTGAGGAGSPHSDVTRPDVATGTASRCSHLAADAIVPGLSGGGCAS